MLINIGSSDYTCPGGSCCGSVGDVNSKLVKGETEPTNPELRE